MTHRATRLLAAAGLVIGAAACGGDGATDAEATTTEVSISPTAASTSADEAAADTSTPTTATTDGTTTEATTTDDTTADPSCPTPAGEATHPEILDVVLTREDDGTYVVEVTLSSTYDSPARYADGWRVLDAEGTVLAEHTLTHDHANEQPFTRSDPGVVIPDGVERVTVEGRDLCNGYGGTTVDVDVPAAAP